MQAALGNEEAHYRALAGVLGKAVPKGLRFKYPSGSFTSAKRIGKLGQPLETAFVGAYMGAVSALKSNELKRVAAQIGANESRHLSVLTNIAAGVIVPEPPLPKVFAGDGPLAGPRPP
jgi:Ferritin-like domain